MEGETSSRQNISLGNVSKFETDVGWAIYNENSNPCQWTMLMEELGFTKTPYDLTSEDFNHVTFVSLAQAEKFFNLYAKALGFGIRKHHKRKDASGVVRSRTWVCSKEGVRSQKYFDLQERKKQARMLTREGCPVIFRVNAIRKTTTWKISKFITRHSHALAASTHLQFITSHRKVPGGALQTAKAMNVAGIRKCHIMGFMAAQVGGFDNVQFLIKDLYNEMYAAKCSVIGDTDAAATLGYLHHKCTIDQRFYGKFSLGPESRLENLLWADHRCRMDYQEYGHTLAFDTTYKTNLYGKPLLVFVGVNNHFRTTIFAFCILLNETTEAYLWALETFIECMDGQKPSTVITDGDMAMKAAIAELMPSSTHRLCSLHIMKNASANVKDQGFPAALSRLMKRHYEAAQFEAEWAAVIETFSLNHSNWAATMYQRKEMWAETFLRGHFFAGMTTTQRSEGMHAYLKANVKSSTKLIDLVRAMDSSLGWLRLQEAREDYLSTNSKPVANLTNMTHVEQHLSSIYTRQMFYKVREEMKREGLYIVSNTMEDAQSITLSLTKYTTKRVVREVRVDKIINTFTCSCYHFPTVGYPCRHIFSVMKFLHVTELPESLVLRRWTIRPRSTTVGNGAREKPWERLVCTQEERFGYMITKTSELSNLAAADNDRYKFALLEIEKLVNVLRGMPPKDSGNDKCPPPARLHDPLRAANPSYVSSKGSGMCGIFGGKKKKCSNCHQPGHNRKTCVLPRHAKGRNSDNDEEHVADAYTSSCPNFGANSHDSNYTSDRRPLTVPHTHSTIPGPYTSEFGNDVCWWGKPYG